MTPITSNTCTLQLPDGRVLGYALLGADRGEAVFTCHGLPGSRMESYLLDEAAKKLNFRIITMDRPGYGFSSPHPNRTLLEWTNDILLLADYLDINTFNIIGISGGAPCTLACTVSFPERINKVALVCGLGPVHLTGLTANMHLLTKLSFWLAFHSPILLKNLVGIPVSAVAKISPALVLKIVGLFNSGVDRNLLNDAQVKKLIMLNIREAFRQGPIGAVHDMKLYSRDWGFKLTDIAKSIEIWHGDMDSIVPQTHGEYYYMHLPDSRFTVVPGEAHFSLPVRHAEKILQRMKDQTE